MDTAFCTLNRTEYTGPQFAALPDAQRAQYRRYLVCVKCETTAYFRKEAKSGQGPCFGARPHTNCPLATPESVRGIGGGGEQDILHNPGTRIVIDEAQGGGPVVNGEPGGRGGAGSSGGRFTGTGSRQNAVSHRRLRPLLKNLIYSAAFRTSDIYVELPGRGAWPARDLFVNFSDVNKCRSQTLYGFWGVIYDTGTGYDDSLWINTGDREVVSIVIDPASVQPFLTRHKITVGELDGSHILVFGTISKSGNGKQYIKPASIELTALNDD